MLSRLATTLIVSLVIATPAFAEPQTVVADGHPVEFIVSPTEVVFSLKDHDGKPLATTGLSAKAYVQADGKTQTLDLKASAPNKLVGALSAPLAPGAKVVFSTKMHGHNIQARFQNK